MDQRTLWRLPRAHELGALVDAEHDCPVACAFPRPFRTVATVLPRGGLQDLRFCPVRLTRGNVPTAIKSMPLLDFDVPGRNIWATRMGAREGICGVGTGIRPA